MVEMVEMVEILDGRLGKRSVERVRYVIGERAKRVRYMVRAIFVLITP